MIHKLELLLTRFLAIRKHKCAVCGHKVTGEFIHRAEVNYEESNLVGLILGYERGYPKTPRGRYWVCNECKSKFDETRERATNALHNANDVKLIYGDVSKSLVKKGKRIYSGWYKSKETCEVDLKNIARYYQVDCVYGIKCEISEPFEFTDPSTPQVSKNNLLFSYEMPEYIYKLHGYINI